jgi:hypothetical protein
MEIEMLDAPEVREEPTAIQQTSIALVQGALTEFDKVEAGLADLRTKYANVVYAVNTAAGMAEAKAARQALRAPRYAVDKILKATKEPLNQIKKDLDARAGRITAAILVFEDPIDGQIKAEEDRKAAEKAERERVAAAQKLVIDNAMTWIRNHAVQAAGKSAADIKELVTSLETMEVTLETFADRSGEAEQCRLMTLDVLNGLHAAVTAQEAAAAQVEAERVRLEQERKEQAAAAQAAAEAAAKAAAEAAETAKAIADAHQARLDEQRRAFMQEQADARARQSALMEQEEAQRKALADERAAFEAEKAAKAAADQKAIDDAALAAAPVILEPAAGAAEIIAQAEAGDVEYITAAAIDPSDADIIFCAARAVSLEYGLTFGEAIHRLAAVESWTQTEGATA